LLPFLVDVTFCRWALARNRARVGRGRRQPACCGGTVMGGRKPPSTSPV